PPPITPAHPVQKAPDFVRQMSRVEKRTQAKIEKREKAEAEREAKLEAEREKQAAQAVKNNQMTKEEFDRRFGNKANSSTLKSSSQVKVAKIDTEGISGGVVGGSTKNKRGGAGGTALTREQADELDAYFSMLLSRLKDAHQRPEGLSDLLTAKVEFYIDHDGTISGVSVIRSSGSPEFDQSVLSAFRKVGSIGPRPDNGGRLRREVTFKMRDD
ncbi:MAG TPA: TonB family protein, partial [Opitutaceae bacterium]